MGLCLAVGLSLALFLFALDSVIDREVENTLDERLAARAEALIDDLATRREESPSLAHPVYGETIYFEVLDRSGRVIATSGFHGALILPAGYRAGRPFNVTLPDGHRARAIASYVPAYDSGQISARRPIVVVAEDRSKTDELSSAVDFIIWVGFAIILLICSGAALLAVRRSLRPLESLGAAATRIAIEESPEMLPLAGMPREIMPLGVQFNRLLRQLRSALDRERDFSENLAHELRTPLAEIRTLSETGRRSTSPQEITASLEEAAAAAVRMQSVTESLLALARASRPPAINAAEPFDIANTVRRCLKERMRSLANAPRVEDRLPHELWTVADPRLAEMILANLLGNALQHGAADAPIELDWLPGDGRGGLRIRNAAPHLTQSDLAELGTRWWRLAKKAGAGSTAGSGLGLSIARSLGEAAGLEISFGLDAEHRLSVTLAGLEELDAAAKYEPT